MRALFQTLICCIITISIYAQKNQTTTNIQTDKTNWITFKTAEQTPATELAQNKTVLQLQDKDDLDLIVEQTDRGGIRHYRYQQTYDGIPIEGAIYLLHEKNNRVKTANGKLIHQLKLNTAPSISVDVALTFALAHIDAELYAWDDPMHENGIKEVKNQPDATFYPSGRLVIIDPEFKQQNTNCKLAYKFDIYAVQPYTRQEVFVDAHDGSIISTIEKIHNCTGGDANGTSNYNGDVEFSACHESGTYILKNNVGGGMQVFYDNYNGDNTEFSEYPFKSDNNSFENMPEAVDVHWATEKTYNYFLDTFNRNSLDGNGMLLKSWVHHDDNFNNAFWTGWCMGYGDGDGTNYSSWTSLDIVAHEMTHGITEYSLANLAYQNESGALNESFSDIFAEMVEWTVTGENDWLIGADLVLTPGIKGLRNMSNPKVSDAKFKQPDTYNGGYWYSGTGDFGGVHINSGVQNYWFYLLSEGGSGTNDNGYTYNISGIGKNKAATIAYHNLTQYLTQNATYADARAGSIQAAIDIYGPDSNEAIQTEEAWCAVGVGCGYTPPNPCIENDSLALVALYNATNGANWTNTWNLNQPMHTWYGVTVNGDGCVTTLLLSSNQLSGNIPPEIGNLSSLDFLYLNNNQLNGSIPPEIGNLSSLHYLYLNNNQLNGSIPPEIGNLNLLIKLYLSNNQLSGCYDVGLWALCDYLLSWEISQGNNLEPWDNFCGYGLGSCTPFNVPTTCEDDSLALVALYNSTDGANWTNTWNLNQSVSTWHGVTVTGNGCVRHINLRNNGLIGNIPPEIGNLSNLTLLFLSKNQLSGNIPSEIGNLGNLTSLELSKNQLSGNIPSEIGNLSRLNTLLLHSNQLSGNIPPEIGNLSNLTSLELSKNQLSGNIPPEIGNLDNLFFLQLNNNQLSGNIPPEIGNLSNLFYLHLYSNQLNGNIPPEIGNLRNLIFLQLYSNQLNGNIPPEIGNLSNLISLELYNNQLNGNVPPEIGNLSNLITLYLHDNQLSGNVPPEIGNLSNLITLYLNDNQLSGNILSEIGNLSNLISLYLNNNQLNGNIPPEIGNLDNIDSLYLNNNFLSGCYNSNLYTLCNQLTDYNISDSNNLDATWDDFCNTGAGRCFLPPVYPGDFNNDGTADQHDILYWGVAEGYTGAARPNATIVWEPQECPEWNGYINGVNLHHSDGDGNGIVDSTDLLVLEQNFGSTQSAPVSSQSPSSTIFGMNQVSTTSSGSDVIINYEIYVQSNTPISAHGISGVIDLSTIPSLISASIDTTGSALHPDAHIEVYDSTQQMICIGLTQTDKSNESLDGPIGTLAVVAAEDFQVGEPIELRTNGGNIMSSNGVVTPISPATFYAIPNVPTGSFDLPVSLVLNNVCGLGSVAAAYPQGNAPYAYAWSTGETTQQVTGLPVGTYSVTVTDANNIEKVIDFEVAWASTPATVTTNPGQICVSFDSVPLTDSVQISWDGENFQSAIANDACYTVSAGTYDVWIRLATDECAFKLGTWEVEAPCTGCSCNRMPANLKAIAGEFGQFADDEFIKNFLTAEKGYIKYQAEIHRILESDDDRYAQVNRDFETVKDMAMAMLFQSFVSKNPVTMTDEHIKAIDNFLVSLSQATSKGKLRNEIVKVRQHIHVMESKEVKDALIAFDRAGAVDISEITPFDTRDQDEFEVQLLNTAGRESRVTYNIVKQGILNMSLYNTHGQQVRTLHDGVSYEGQHQIPIDKNGLPPGIYFIHIEYVADGVPINKILKLPVMK